MNPWFPLRQVRTSAQLEAIPCGPVDPGDAFLGRLAHLGPRPTEGTGAEWCVVVSDAGGRATGDDALVDDDEDRGDDDAHDQGDPVDP